MKKPFLLFLLFIAFKTSFAQSVGGSVGGSTTVCSGTNSGIVTLSGHIGNVVRWQSSTTGGASWSNINNTTVNLVYANLSTTIWYRAEVLLPPSPPNISAFSTPAIISVDAPSSGVINTNASVCSGSNSGVLSLTGTFTNISGWGSSTDGGATWAPIVNTTTVQAYSNLTATTIYRADITNGSCPSATATAATITVNPLSVGGSIAGSTTVCSSSNSGTLTLNGNTGSVLRWQSSDDGGTSWSNITSSTGVSLYNYSNITETTEYRAVVQSGNCAITNSSSATITVDPASVGGNVSPAATVCSGTNNGSLTLSGYTGNILRWENSVDGGSTWIPILNTSTNQTYNNLTASTLYRAVIKSGGCASSNSATTLITVSSSSVGGTISGTDTVCASSNSGTLLLTGNTGNVIRWQYSDDDGASWTNISNTTTIHNYSNVEETTQYRAVVQSGNCVIINSSTATITVDPSSVGGSITSSATVCSGINNGTLELTGQTGNVLNWERSVDNGSSWTSISNTSDTLSYFNITTKTIYRANVQSGSCGAQKSTTATINISLLSIGGIMSGTDTVCRGSNSGTLSLTGYNGNIVKWQSSTNGGSSWTTISNTSAFYNYSNLTTTTNYRAVIQSASCPTTNSSETIITVFSASDGGIVSADATVCSGINNGTLQATGYTGTILNWEKSTDNGLNWNSISNIRDTLSYFNLTTKTLYRISVQSGTCAIQKSTVAAINIYSLSVGGSILGNDTVCSGTNSGTLTLSGHTGNVLRWQSSDDGGVSWSNITNTTGSGLYNYANISSTAYYRAVIQNGSCPVVNSSHATITVLPVSVGGALTPETYSACSGINNGTILLNGHSGNIIRWESSADGGITWPPIANTSAIHPFSNLTGTALYRALIQKGQCPAAYSDISTISVLPPSVGGIISASDTVCSGTNNGTLSLSGTTGDVLHWEYSKNGGSSWTNISNSSAIQNYTNLNATTIYRAVLKSGSCATANSSMATITVNPVTVGGNVSGSTIICDSLTGGALTLSGHTGSVLHWKSSMDNGSTWTTIANTTNTQVYSGITTTTIYKAIVQSGVCPSQTSKSATISLAAPIVASYTYTVTGTTVIFTNTSAGNGGTHFWNFGDNTSSTVTNPAHTYTATGSYSVRLAVSDSCGSDTAIQTVFVSGLGISEFTYNNPDVIIYPNPFNNYATIQLAFDQPQSSVFKLFDFLGQEVRTIPVEHGNKTLTLQRENLPAGIYFYHIQSSREIIATGKIVVQ